MDRCLLDTSSLSDVIQPSTKRRANVATHLTRYLRSHGRLSFSEISCYEILRGLRKKRAGVQTQQFADFCQRSELLPVTYEVLDRAASLWADGQELGESSNDADLIIAATALVHDIALVTANTRHFAWIGDLRTFDWRAD